MTDLRNALNYVEGLIVGFQRAIASRDKRIASLILQLANVSNPDDIATIAALKQNLAEASAKLVDVTNTLTVERAAEVEEDAQEIDIVAKLNALQGPPVDASPDPITAPLPDTATPAL